MKEKQWKADASIKQKHKLININLLTSYILVFIRKNEVLFLKLYLGALFLQKKNEKNTENHKRI